MRSVVTRLDELNNDDGWMDEKGEESPWRTGTSLLYLSTSHSFAQTFQNNVAVTTLLPMDMVLFSLDVVASAKERNNKEAPRHGDEWNNDGCTDEEALKSNEHPSLHFSLAPSGCLAQGTFSLSPSSNPSTQVFPSTTTLNRIFSVWDTKYEHTH